MILKLYRKDTIRSLTLLTKEGLEIAMVELTPVAFQNILEGLEENKAIELKECVFSSFDFLSVEWTAIDKIQ